MRLSIWYLLLFHWAIIEAIKHEGGQSCETVELGPFNPSIKFTGPRLHSPSLADFHLQGGSIEVPSDYRDYDSKRFDVDFTQYSKSKERIPPRYHIIMLPGGPGARAWETETFIRAISKNLYRDRYYAVEYRGVREEGGFISPAKANLDNTPKTLDGVISNGPFPVKDLTFENAARDIAMLIEAIKKSKEWLCDAKIVLYGFSAGARWAHLIASQYPDHVDLAFLGGVPTFADLRLHNHLALIELCQHDTFCRNKMGGDAFKALKTSLWNVRNANFNACTRAFHENFTSHDLPKNAQKALTSTKLLIRFVRRFISFFSDHVVLDTQYLYAQVALIFIKAMNDCQRPQRFIEHVLPMLERLKIFRWYSYGQKSVTRKIADIAISRDPDAFDGFANSLISINSDYNPVIRWSVLKASNKYMVDTHRIPALLFPLKQKWKLLEPYVHDARYFEEEVATSHKTKFFIFASRADTVTTPSVAKSLYDRIVSPLKVWILYDSLSHPTGYAAEGHFNIVADAIRGLTHPSEIHKNIRSVDEKARLDWTFSNPADKLPDLWEQVRVPPYRGKWHPYMFPRFLVERNRELVGPSPPPKAYCMIVSSHPRYVEKFAIKQQ